MQTATSRSFVCDRIEDMVARGFHCIVVVSAMGRKGDVYATDTLLSLADFKEETTEIDLVQCCGEFISASLLTALLKTRGINCTLLYGSRAGLVSDQELAASRMELCSHTVQTYPVTIIPGFHFLSEDGLLTTFGRGGSDYTALLYAAYFECEALFYKDVPGAYYPPDSRTIVSTLTHDQLCELEVLQQQAAEFARQKNIPLSIMSFQTSESGTLIRSPVPKVL